MSTFRELVNDVVMESKLTLDPLEAGEFHNPPRTSLYDRIKRWINISYEELLTDKPEWFFTSRSAVVTVKPRLKLSGLTPSVLLQPVAVGDVLVGDVSGVEFTVEDIDYSIKSDDVGYSITVDVSYSEDHDDNEVVLNETFSRVLPAASAALGRITGRGVYSFRRELPAMDDFLEGTVEIQPAVDYTDDPSPTALNGLYPIESIPISRWRSNYDSFDSASGTPVIIATARDGNILMYPRPDKEYDVSFTYSVKGTPLVEEDDVPVLLPEKFHPYLLWKTLQELADFNQDPKMFSRAKKHVDKYMFKMARDMLPKPGVDLGRFDLNRIHY